MGAGLRFVLELRRGKGRQMHGLGGVVEKEGLVRRGAKVLFHEFAAFLEEEQIHFLHREIWCDEAIAAVVRIGVLWQF